MERPGRRSLVARGKEALIVGAGDAGQLIIREMHKSPQLGYTPIGLVDDDAAQEEHAAPRRPRAGHDVGARRGSWPTTGPTRSSSPSPPAPARRASEIVNACRDAGVPVKTLPAVHELISRRPQPLPPAPRGAGGGRPRARGRRARPRRRSPPTSRAKPCSSLAPAARSARSSAARSRRSAPTGSSSSTTARTHSSTSSASSQRERNYTATVPALADVKDPGKMRRLFERYQPGGRLPRRRLQARPAHGGEPARIRAEQRLLRRAVIADVAAELGVKRFVLVSTDKAVKPKNVLGQTKARLRVDRRGGRRARGERHELHLRPFRQRARLLGKRDPALPPSDRARRAGHRHTPGHDPLLHDDPGGGAAHHPGRSDRRRAATSTSSTWARR